MKLGLRVFIGYFLALGISAWLSLHWIEKELRPLVRQASEETLVETAYALAATVQPSFAKTGTIAPSFAQSLTQLANTKLHANIWGTPKQTLGMEIYITNAKGVVLFDSTSKNTGKDFSQWNDVYLTLRGQYGVRSTRSDPKNEGSSSMHVAAPIKNGEEIIGALTVAFPNENVQTYLSAARNKLYLYGIYILLGSLLIGILFTGWLIHSLHRISTFAEHATDRKNVIPDFAKGTELEKLTTAISHMRDELEGHHHLENYVNHFTHELKSPLSAIRASNELLADSRMTEQQRMDFVANVDQQCKKLQILTDRLLQLIRLEKKRQLDKTERISLAPLIKDEIESLRYLATKRNINFVFNHSGNDNAIHDVVTGDALLLAQAVHNLLENALQFSLPDSAVDITCQKASNSISITVYNSGPCIPDYALLRLGERFYSLPHLDGSKGTGLGLAFVHEIASLHGGNFQISNTSTGVRCELTLPVK